MNIRTSTKLFLVLECIYKNGDMTEEEVVIAMREAAHRESPCRIKKILDDAVAQFHLHKRRNRYFLSDEAEAFVADMQDIKDRKPKHDLVAPPYRNIWTAPISGYTEAMFRNKRTY